MVGLGVASFGHVNGVHVQNLDTWETYGGAIGRGEMPLSRAYRPTDEERMIRELVLQLKRGSIRPPYFRDKYRRRRPRAVSRAARLARGRRLPAGGRADLVALTREGLLRVDALLPRFFLPEHAGIRYT